MKKEIIKWIIISISIIALLNWGIPKIKDNIVFRETHEKICIESHKKQYVEQPLSIIVGGGEYGGGIGIPLGEGEIKEREVCDKWEWRKK